ncbi:MAG: GNAT family N-acetyltransferase [Gammaproteobacteria bacterium]|nr:GNAT family N-acetyltransferase [Gammaproteobacteria bacterium]
MNIETTRLTLTTMNNEDWPIFEKLYQNQDIIKFVSDGLSPEQVNDKFLSRMTNWHIESEQWLTLVIRDKVTDQAIGIIGIIAQWLPYRQSEIGFLLFPQFHGQGLAKEAASALLNFVFNDCGFHKVTACVVDGNNASIKLLQSLGFVHEGCLREGIKLRGQWYNDIRLGLLHHEYQSI